MKIPLFSKLTAKSRGRKVVRASAARSARGHDDDYYEMEPNMKLSHAFMVVLILHIVAVGGIYAFNHINARKSSTNLLSNISDRIAQAAGGAPAAAPALSAEPVRQPGDADEPLPLVTSDSATAGTLVRTAPAELAPVSPVATKAETAPPVVAKKEAPVPAAAAQPKAASGPVPEGYKVAKGDNPYNIAKKFGVSYQDLLTLNGIDDPTKLQIGQELKIPKKAN
jgi:LysM repeat protein